MGISNRTLITKFCHERNLKIKSLEFIRCFDYAYGDSWNDSHWSLEIYFGESDICVYDTTLGDTISDGIKLMFDAIEDDVKEYVNG